eukprot:SAG31_NODE_190_length_20810_cov_20.296364_4_plen_51_part_00
MHCICVAGQAPLPTAESDQLSQAVLRIVLLRQPPPEILGVQVPGEKINAC